MDNLTTDEKIRMAAIRAAAIYSNGKTIFSGGVVLVAKEFEAYIKHGTVPSPR